MPDIEVPCPTCSGTGESTHEDRHAGTDKDICRTCGGKRTIPARPGESRETSWPFAVPGATQSPSSTPGEAERLVGVINEYAEAIRMHERSLHRTSAEGVEAAAWWWARWQQSAQTIKDILSHISTAGRASSPTPDGVIKERGEDGRTWDEGITYGLKQLCAMLNVDPSKVRWDAATETVEGDVCSVIGNILRAWAGDDWQDLPAIREMLLEGQGDDDGNRILPDFQESMTVHAMVAACVHLLERRRDALDGYANSPSSQEIGVGETFDTIRQWCEETFGPATPERIASRAAEEMDELLADPSKVEEAADIVIILSRHPTLWAEIERKMSVNRKRQWRLMGDGTGYHVKEVAPRPSQREG